MSSLVMHWAEIHVGHIIHNDNGEDYVVVAINPQADRTLLVKANTNKPFYVGAWALQKCQDGVHWYWGQGHYFMTDLEAAVNYVMDIKQKVYTVHRQSQYDYDFSVEDINYNCYKTKEEAMVTFCKEVQNIKLICTDDMETYSDKEEYDDEDDGALCINDDIENGYFHMHFGYQENRENHTVWVQEWEVK